MQTKKDSIVKIYEGSQEERNLEFKRGFSWSKSSPETLDLIKSVIAMFNTPEGGDVVLGIKQVRNDSRLLYPGIKTEEREIFEKKEEEIKDVINSFTTIDIDPLFTVVEDYAFDPFRLFIIIKIPNYKEYPCLVKRDGYFMDKKKNKRIYRFHKSDLLTRSKFPRFSSRKVQQEELNEMIELCAKGVRTKCRDILNIKTEEQEETKADKKLSDKFKKERSPIYGNISA
jgi:hypothetical protein